MNGNQRWKAFISWWGRLKDCHNMSDGIFKLETIQLIEAIDKKLDEIRDGNKCTTCQGYGMWAFGEPSSMGRMDAEDGTPTIPCPECKADKNQSTKNKNASK